MHTQATSWLLVTTASTKARSPIRASQRNDQHRSSSNRLAATAQPTRIWLPTSKTGACPAHAWWLVLPRLN